MSASTHSFLPWFRLLRLPNLLTVPGDPAAGFLLAAAGAVEPPRPLALAAAAGASLCLYAFGLVLNDMLDLETDRRERPDRPLPAGEITVHQARMAAIALALSGLNLALVAGRLPLYAAAALAALIALYNAWLKRIRGAGVAALGLCRGLSLLLGAAAARPELFAKEGAQAAPVWIAAAGLAFYVAAFSAVARHETDPEKPMGPVRWMPFAAALAVLLALVAAVAAQRRLDGLAPTVYVFLMSMTLLRAWLLGGWLYRLQPVCASVGGHIRNLLMIQGCYCAAAGAAGLLPALTFVFLSFVFAKLSKRFYSS